MLIRLAILASAFNGVWSLAFMEGPTVESCSEDRFPSATSIYISIKDAEGREVGAGLCSGNVVEDPRMVLTDSHCLLSERELSSPFGPLPRSIRDHYFPIGRKDGKKNPYGLHTEYIVNGIKAKHTVEFRGRQAILVLEKPTSKPVAPIAYDHAFEKGTVCQFVGFSPSQELRAKGLTKKEDLALEDYVARTEARSKVLSNPVKRCGQTAYAASLGENSDLSLFNGKDFGGASSEPGDSGGACYVKNAKGEWAVAGVLEMGEVKDYLDENGTIQKNYENPSNNAFVLFGGTNRTNLENLFSEARKLRDRGAPVFDQQRYFGDPMHVRVMDLSH